MNRHTLSRKQQYLLHRAAAIIGIVSLVVTAFPVLPANALPSLTTPRIYLGREQASLTTGESFQIFFTTTSAVNGGAGANKLKIAFPNDAQDNTKWCNTVGTGDLVVTAITNPTGATETATAPGGSLTGACTQTPDTFTVSGLNNLSATTKYGIQIVEHASPSTKIGSGTNTSPTTTAFTLTTNNGTTDVDSGTGYVTLISNDQLAVTATINPQISVTLSGNTAALGTLDTGHVNQAGITSQVTTNSPNGYVSLVNYNNTLTDATSDTIADAASTTLAIGTEGYGVSTSMAGQTITQWSPTTCATTTSTSNILKLQTSFQKFASNAAAANAETTTLCFEAGISTSTKPGSYTSTATLVTTARF